MEVRYGDFERAQRADEATSAAESVRLRVAGMRWEDVLKDPEVQALDLPKKEQVLRGYFINEIETDPEYKATVAKDPDTRATVWKNMWGTLREPASK